MCVKHAFFLGTRNQFAYHNKILFFKTKKIYVYYTYVYLGGRIGGAELYMQII